MPQLRSRPGVPRACCPLCHQLAAAAQVLEARLAKPVEVKRSPKRPATRRNNDQDDYDDDYGLY